MADCELPSDGQVIADVLAGAADRFGEIVRRYEAPLRRVAESRLGRHDWAEEVVQESFLAAYRGLASYDSAYSFRTWLWTILLNQCRRRQGYEGREPRVWNWSERDPREADATPAWSEAICPRPDPAAQLLERERSEQLERLLRALPEAQADALRLRFYGELKFQEIADALRCSLLTAKNRVRAGLLKLAAALAADHERQDGPASATLRPLPFSAPEASGGSTP